MSFAKLTPSESRTARLYYWASVARYPDNARAGLWHSAKRQIFFRQELAASIKAHKKRSAAAKRGWKARRQNQF